MKNYDMLIIGLDFNEISAKTPKHWLFTLNSAKKMSFPIKVKFCGGVNGDTRKISTSVSLPNSVPITIHGPKRYSCLESSVSRKMIFTVMQRSIPRFSIWNFNTVRICDALANFGRSCLFFIFVFQRSFSRVSTFLGLVSVMYLEQKELRTKIKNPERHV